MVRLIDDLLDVSRNHRNKLELRREQIDLRAVVAKRRGNLPPADRCRRP